MLMRWMRMLAGPLRGAGIAVVAVAALLLAWPAPGGDYDDNPEDAVVVFNGIKIAYRYAVLMVTPGSDNQLRFVARAPGREVEVYDCDVDDGACQVEGAALTWTAPKKSGNYWLRVNLCFRSPRPGEKNRVDQRLEWVLVCALVGYPGAMIENGFLNGFELGLYPDWREMKRKEYYKPPKYFYYMDSDLPGLFLSEHVHLGDLGYDGRAPFPQYFTLDYNLVKKLEVIHDELEARGLPSRYHYIGGGFISPKSNLERTSRDSAASELSRHMWGEAIDLIIDDDGDEVIDDLNRDGRIDVRDALFLRELVHKLEDEGKCTPGGVGVYAPPRNSSIQLHIDVRGYATDWGYKTYDPEEFSQAPAKRSLKPTRKKETR